jgi:hypothetical protein
MTGLLDIEKPNLPSWENFKLNWEKGKLNWIFRENTKGVILKSHRLRKTPKPMPMLIKSGFSKVKPTR